MKPGAPWSIKGVDADAREIAKAKARAADLTLGQWLNQAIAEADKPAVAAAPPAQAGSSLDTARLMRAISEVARRVDQVKDGPGATVDLGRVEQALAQMGRRMEALEQRAPAAPDLSDLTRGLGALGQKLDRVDRRVEGLAGDESARAAADSSMATVLEQLQGLQVRMDQLAEDSATTATESGAVGEAALQADMRRVMNGMLNLARKIDGVEAQVAGQLAPLMAEIADLRAATGADSADAEVGEEPAIESLRDDLLELKQMVAAQSTETNVPQRDLGQDITLALAPVLAQLGELRSRIEQKVQAPAPEAEARPEPESEARPEPEPAPPAVPTPDPGIVVAADTPPLIDSAAAAPSGPDASAMPDPPMSDFGSTEVSDDADTRIGDAIDEDDAPMQRPEPGALQALHDLTARRDTVSRRIEPILRDLPEVEREAEQAVDDQRAAEDDDRPDFDAVTDSTDPAPTMVEPEPQLEPETGAASETRPEPMTEPEPDIAAPAAMEPGPESIRQSESIQDPIDQQLADRDDGDGGKDEDIPAVAAAPDRPRRIVPVESLLAGGDQDQAIGAAPAEPSLQTNSEDERVREMPLGAPMAAERAVTDEPRARRRGGGYIVAALIFLAVLIGGFFLIGSDRFSQWVDQGKQMVAALTDMVPVSDARAPADGATPDAASATPADTSSGEIVSGDEPSLEPVAPTEPVQQDSLASQSDEAAPVSITGPAIDAAPAQAPASDNLPVAEPPVATAPVVPAVPDVAAGSDLATLQAQAEAGDAEAQFQLAVRYRDGDGVGVSYGESAAWFQRAAEQGNVPSQVNLGIFYRQGVGVAKDIDLAKVWFHAAARAGHPEAQNFLGQVYAGEEQERPDYFQAARWFREAAEQGVLDAQYNLASLYMGGLGVPRDDAQAYFWFGIAARQGDADASANQANVAAELSPAERAEQDARIAGFRAISQFSSSDAGSAAANRASAASGDAVIRRRDQIRLIQRLLISRGYDPGEPDGLPGEQTREAIRQFEADNALTVTGKITGTVLQALQQGG